METLNLKFEAAADAIITGDIARLGRLLGEYPQLINARSTREHRATLLHYVSANGVEDVRQKTPNNIVEITKILLDAGAQVNAECDAYGGGAATLGLVATSIHPERAGVQPALMDLLLIHGAIMDAGGRSIVIGCLANGRGRAAEFLAARGAHLNLEGACGVGNLAVVQSFFNSDGSLKANATQEQMMAGFGWACEFGRTGVVEFLLDQGIDVAAPVQNNGQTGLHWAAFGGHIDIVKLLLARNAPVEANEKGFHETPLGWAVYAWSNPPSDAKRESYNEVITLLVRAGAKTKPEWLDWDSARPESEQFQKDSRMMAALQGKFSPS